MLVAFQAWVEQLDLPVQAMHRWALLYGSVGCALRGSALLCSALLCSALLCLVSCSCSSVEPWCHFV